MSESRSTTKPAGPGMFSAADIKRRMAEREAQKAADELRHMKEQEEKQKAVMAEFHKPADRSPEQLMQVLMQLVTRARRARTDRSPSLPFSQQSVHRWRPTDQQLVAQLGGDIGG